MKEFAAPVNIVEITSSEMGGAGDFSAATIARRRHDGYAAAEQSRRTQRAA